jgi:Fe-S cluster assembly protein SufD
LADRRRAAAAALGSTPSPTAEAEEWRYSPVGELDLDRYDPTAAPPASAHDEVAEIQRVLDAIPERSATVVVRDGRIVLAEVSPGLADAGLTVGPLAEVGDASLGDLAHPQPPDAIALRSSALATDPVLVSVPAGLVVADPVVIVDWVDVEGAAVHPKLVVRAGRDAEVSVVSWQGSADVDAVVLPTVILHADDAARVRYLEVQDRGARVTQVGWLTSSVGRDADLSAAHAVLGAAWARNRVDCRLVGRGASARVSAVYHGHEDQTLDFRTFQHHEAPDTTSDLLFGGALGDRSRAIYTGLIKIHADGAGSRAFQTNRTLKLSDDAWAESVPNLEIEHNDVQCSHASTVSPVDPEQRWYLESRGVPDDVAEQLVVQGFLDDVVSRFPVPSALAPVRWELAERVARNVDRARAEGAS